MIRDPSDGSVKEITPTANEINEIAHKKRSERIMSGLPTTKETAEENAGLKRSREWLADYLNKRKPVAI